MRGNLKYISSKSGSGLFKLPLLYLFWLLFAGISLKAQDHIRTGLKGGVSATTLSRSLEDAKEGLHLGAMARLGAQEPVYFQSELLFSQKGARWVNGNKTHNLSLFYLELPLILGLEITENLFFNAGFQASLLLFEQVLPREAAIAHIGRFDYLTLASIEYLFKNKFLAGLRYTHGFVPVTEERNSIFVTKSLPVNRQAGIYLAYLVR